MYKFYTIPHFLYGTGNPDLLERENNNVTTPVDGLLTHFCSSEVHSVNVSTVGVSSHPSAVPESTVIPFAMFVIASIIHGMSGSVIWTLGMMLLADGGVTSKTPSRSRTSKLHAVGAW